MRRPSLRALSICTHAPHIRACAARRCVEYSTSFECFSLSASRQVSVGLLAPAPPPSPPRRPASPVIRPDGPLWGSGLSGWASFSWADEPAPAESRDPFEFFAEKVGDPLCTGCRRRSFLLRGGGGVWRDGGGQLAHEAVGDADEERVMGRVRVSHWRGDGGGQAHESLSGRRETVSEPVAGGVVGR
jgi:hypothetical protein